MTITYNIIDSKNNRILFKDIKSFSNTKAIIKAFNKDCPNRCFFTIVKRNSKGEVIKESDWD